ncbi:serine O-acetyltransferase [Loigolactobacillus zhaoyuanensis]|uniref:Serine acetyltransferase n=1 Tax=Loigolactobacillus zhaoyuanensis TaxID=2486017 RepID=A0ABW8U9R9_9LACO|nr:serine O-acetyltransferase [Loigolactobacillus zhaoyuanensis]
MFATAKAIQRRDPAAHSLLEVLLTYSGLHALTWHRCSHWLYHHHQYLAASISAHLAKKITGIEIHPGAQIGRQLFIDHGTGVVIGETAIIGDNVTILHGVTLGSRHTTSGRRHPRIGNNVLIGAHAQILGPITINNNAKIGAGAVVLANVAAGRTAVGVPAQIQRSTKIVHLAQN